MALEEYKRKRNFAKTPEPEGEVAPKRDKRFFCVQKHLASHLHYDFRLEHNGVLLSWAVPKGPSLDPSTKRLAMMVEDHPIEYGTFEGVIPSGYGAGIVMLWDRGTWTPEVDDVDAALKKGDLKFTLSGYKLKGSWVLVRTKGKWAGGGDRSWLLIKHRDDWAGDVVTGVGPCCSSRSLSTLQTANASRRRSWRAISVHQKRPWTTSISESNSPSSSGSLCSAAYFISPSSDGRPVLAITTSTGRPI